LVGGLDRAGEKLRHAAGTDQIEKAASLLGAGVHGIDSHEQYSQNERLEDRIRFLNEYPHGFLLIRYEQDGRPQPTRSRICSVNFAT
jgi:hypothetical protein